MHSKTAFLNKIYCLVQLACRLYLKEIDNQVYADHILGIHDAQHCWKSFSVLVV